MNNRVTGIFTSHIMGFIVYYFILINQYNTKHAIIQSNGNVQLSFRKNDKVEWKNCIVVYLYIFVNKTQIDMGVNIDKTLLICSFRRTLSQVMRFADKRNIRNAFTQFLQMPVLSQCNETGFFTFHCLKKVGYLLFSLLEGGSSKVPLSLEETVIYRRLLPM